MNAIGNLVEQTRGLLGSLVARPLAPFLAEWPGATKQRRVQPSALPVLRWLPETARDAPSVTAGLVSILLQTATSMAWRQTYTVTEVGADFLENYGWTEIIGQHGPLASESIACGFLLLGPSTLYPRHRHEADEIYLPLAGRAAWQRGDGRWREQAPGSLIHHGSGEPHAMLTHSRPLLALYLWRSADLSQRSRLDAPPN